MTMRATGLLVLVLLTGACVTPPSRPPGGPPDEPPYIEGALTTINRGASGALLLVEEPGEGGNKAAVTISFDTPIIQEFGGGYEPSGYEQLAPGSTVAVWITGPVRESFPVQVTAAGIVIRER